MFCSMRCSEWYNAGNPPHGTLRQVTDVPLCEWRVVAGPPSIDIGSSYYGTLLDRNRPRRGIEPSELIRPRRQCKACTRPLPVWDARGKKVPSNRTLCDGCRS
jgi:hypothetical protein